MKTYIEQNNGYLVIDGKCIPNTASNSDYVTALLEVAAGEATIDLYEGSQRQADDVAAEQARASAEAIKQAKLSGVEFEGVMCSATKEDMWGLASVKDWVRSGASTHFNFDNGNTLLLTPQNIDAFEAVWVPFRASFF